MQFGVISPCTILLCPFQKKNFLFPSVWPSREYTRALIWKNLSDFWFPKGRVERGWRTASHLQIYLSRTFTKAKKFLKIEEVEYLIHYVKFKMWPALLILCKFPTFWMLVLACTLFPPIYREIENWDFECCSRLDFPIFPMMKEVKNWSFLD